MKWAEEDQPLPWDNPDHDVAYDLTKAWQESRDKYYTSGNYYRYEQ